MSVFVSSSIHVRIRALQSRNNSPGGGGDLTQKRCRAYHTYPSICELIIMIFNHPLSLLLWHSTLLLYEHFACLCILGCVDFCGAFASIYLHGFIVNWSPYCWLTSLIKLRLRDKLRGIFRHSFIVFSILWQWRQSSHDCWRYFLGKPLKSNPRSS